MPALSKTNTRYVRFQTYNGVGYGCFVFNWQKENNEISYTVGMSFCSPHDVFRKRVGRSMAFTRMQGTRKYSKYMNISGSVPNKKMGFVCDEEFISILDKVIFEGAKVGLVPGWAEKAFDKNNFRLGLTMEQMPQRKKLSK